MRRNFDISFIILVVILASNSIRRGAFSDPAAWLMDIITMLPAIIIGLSLHEYAHAFAAYKLGDPTPKMQGRVTINPMAHIDPLGFAALVFAGFGWGVPVQINPANFRNRRRDELIVSIAGVTMNFVVAVVFTLVAKVILLAAGPAFLSSGLGSALWTIIIYVIYINLILMVFNLIPCPPLDGFSIVSEIFNLKTTELYWRIYSYGNWILVALIIFGITGKILTPCVSFLFGILQGFII